MKQTIRTVAMLILLAIVVLLWWGNRSGYFDASLHSVAIKSTAAPPITHPIDFAKSHFTGGIGAALAIDSQTGLVYIIEPRTGSPAQKAGLLKGDIITRVNGAPTKGKKLAHVVEEIRGLAGREVTLTIQRGATNLEVAVYRESWSGLGIPQAPLPVRPAIRASPAPFPATPPSTNPP